METFNDIINSDKPVLVDFYAEVCTVSKAMEPTIQEVARSTAGIARVIKINIVKNDRTAQDYNISSVPTLILFRKGKILWRHPGMIDKATLLYLLVQYS